MDKQIRVTGQVRREIDLEKLAHALLEHLLHQTEVERSGAVECISTEVSS